MAPIDRTADHATDDPHDLVLRADADPGAVRAIAEAALADAPPDLDPSDAIRAWALGLALRHLRELKDAELWLRRAVVALQPGTDDHTGASLSLSGTLAFHGRFADAEEVLSACSPSVDMAGRVQYQRAAMAEHQGDLALAIEGYEASLAGFRLSGDRLGEAHALSGLALVRVAAADAPTALAEFGLAMSIYQELDLPLLAAIQRHNLGFAALRAGDTVAAMRHLAAAEREVRPFDGSFVEIGLDRVEALLVAGFEREAIDKAAEVASALETNEVDAERGPMLIGLARTLASAGHHDLANRYLDIATSYFDDQPDDYWRRIARLRRLEFEGSSASDLDELQVLAEGFRSVGHIEHACEASLVAIDVALRVGDLERARRDARFLIELPHGDPRRGVGEAVLGELDGDLDRAVAAAVGLLTQAVDDSLLLTLDLRAGIVAQRQRATDAALRAAVRARSPWAVVEIVAAMQAAILTSMRGRSVSPGLDDEILAALRSHPTPEQWRDIESDVRLRDRTSSSAPAPAPGIADPVLAGVTMPVWIVVDHDPDVTIVRFDESGATLMEAPERRAVLDVFRRFDGALVRWATEPATPTAAHQLETLASAVKDVLPWLGDGPGEIAVCATGEFARCAWAGVADRPVRLIVDLEVGPPEVHHGGSLLVSGPGLVSGAAEVDALRGVLDDASVLEGADANPAQVVEAVGQVDVVHLVCHATHESANPMLSSYELSGGNLTGYEIDRKGRAPRLVVAAACRAGRSGAQGGALAVGTATAWLSAGSSTVVAPLCPIPDDERTTAAMVSLHGLLRQGLSAEAAVFALRSRADAVVARGLQVVGRLTEASAVAAAPGRPGRS